MALTRFARPLSALAFVASAHAYGIAVPARGHVRTDRAHVPVVLEKVRLDGAS